MTAARRPETLAEARQADRIASRSRDLLSLVAQRRAVEANITRTVAGLRRDGVSWARIGRILDVSAQAAQQRFDKKR